MVDAVYKRICEDTVELDENQASAIKALRNVLLVLQEPLERVGAIPMSDFESLEQYATAASAYVAAYDKLTELLTESKASDEAIMQADLVEDYEKNH